RAGIGLDEIRVGFGKPYKPLQLDTVIRKIRKGRSTSEMHRRKAMAVPRICVVAGARVRELLGDVEILPEPLDPCTEEALVAALRGGPDQLTGEVDQAIHKMDRAFRLARTRSAPPPPAPQQGPNAGPGQHPAQEDVLRPAPGMAAAHGPQRRRSPGGLGARVGEPGAGCRPYSPPLAFR